MENHGKAIKSVRLVYFSGTGNTALVAGRFRSELEAAQVSVAAVELRKGFPVAAVDEDLLLVVYPVHGLNAPRPVYDWIRRTPRAEGKPCAVISVSGGGEPYLNSACRSAAISRLKRRGFAIRYERGLVMPSNWIVPTEPRVAKRLVEIMPERVAAAVADLLGGRERRTRPRFADRVLSRLGELEKQGARRFGKRILCGDSCTGCGLCSRECPAGNILMRSGRPSFGSECDLCLRCLYDCPVQALKPGALGFILIKEGFSLNRIQSAKVAADQPIDLDAVLPGKIWSGVRDYLLGSQ